MFIDTNSRGKGQFKVFADVTGSYGEVIHRQVGANYVCVENAAQAAFNLAASGHTNVVLKNTAARPFRVHYFDTDQCMALKREDDRRINAAKGKRGRPPKARALDSIFNRRPG